MGILHAFWSTCWLTMFSSDLPDRRHCTMDGKPRKRGVFHAWHSRRLNAHSPSVSRLALPPAAAVLMVKTFSVAQRGRSCGPPALGPVPESRCPPKDGTPTTAPPGLGWPEQLHTLAREATQETAV